MNAREVASRILSQQSRVPGHHISQGRVGEHEWRLIVDTGTLLGPTKILIDDSTALSPTSLRAKASAAKVRGMCDLLIVDYIGLMRGDRKYESRNVEIGEISGGLMALAKDLDVPVLALSQLNRASERDERRPDLHDLRDSGSLEQDAHIVMFLYRSKEDDGKPTEVLVKKNRAGRIGTVLLEWTPSITRFDDYEGV
jgi:replicative DNA helicase